MHVLNSASSSKATRSVAAIIPKTSIPSAIGKKIAQVAISAAVSLTLVAGPSQAAEMRNLADVMRPVFGFVDSNKDGIVTLQELQQLSTKVRLNMPILPCMPISISHLRPALIRYPRRRAWPSLQIISLSSHSVYLTLTKTRP